MKKFYISETDKKYIKGFCERQIKSGDLIRAKSLVCLLEEKYAVWEVLRYIKEILHIDKENIWRDNAEYIYQLPRGHWQLVNDLHFSNCYLHQYIVSKELDIPIEQVKKYIIHHIDQNKSNNNIENLFVFYDIASHIAYHQAIKHDNTDINKLNENYIESILNGSNAKEIKEYLLVLDKLQKVKKISFSIPVLKLTAI